MNRTSSPGDIYNHLDAIFNTVIDGIIIIDEKGIMQAANPAASRIFGLEAHEMTGNNVSMLMPEPDRGRHDTYISNYLTTGIKKIIGIGREVTGRRKDGTTFPMRLSISESIIDDRSYFTGVVHDIAEIVEARAELEQVNRQLEKIVSQRTEEITRTVNKLLAANAQLKNEITRRQETELELEDALEKEKELNLLKSQFVTMASHEFRTPLSTILSSASIISRYDQAEQQDQRERHVSKIKSSVSSMIHILEDILSLGKLEEGKVENKPEQVDLVQCISDQINQLSGSLKAGQHIALETSLDTCEVVWDCNLMERILNNLISNASKYSAENKPIVLKVSEENENVTISVKDEGIGIPLEQQKHLFDRFFRATNAVNIKGTGLGLHIVSQYVAMMKGKIEFSSAPDLGSTFKITIPKSYT